MLTYVYGTADTMYQTMGNDLVGMLREWLPAKFVATKNTMNLHYNICERAYAHRRLAESNPLQATAWLDADVVPIQEPTKLLDWDKPGPDGKRPCDMYDIAVTCRPVAPDPAHRHCCGVVLWPPGGGRGLSWFCATLENDPNPCQHCREQWYLSKCIRELNLRVLDLGEEYNDDPLQHRTVIYHSGMPNKTQHDLRPVSIFDRHYRAKPDGNYELRAPR